MTIAAASVHVQVEGGGALAPGTNVYLATPTANEPPLHFEHYQVTARHTLGDGSGRTQAVRAPPADAQRIPVTTLDPGHAYWCVYGAGAAAPPDGPYGEAPGFGFPLLAHWREHTLVLPGTKHLHVRVYNLSGGADAEPRLTGNQTAAQEFLRKLHVELTLDPQPRPAGMADLYKRDNVIRFLPPGTYVDEPPGAQAAVQRLVAGADVLVGFWIQEIYGGANGFATMFTPLIPGGAIQHDVIGFPLRRGQSSLFFVARVDHGGSGRDFVHEIVHCLLFDPGLGRRQIEGNPGWRASVEHFLGGLGFPRSIPAAALYDLLPLTNHKPDPANLMNTTASGSQLDQLQVAILRRAAVLR